MRDETAPRIPVVAKPVEDRGVEHPWGVAPTPYEALGGEDVIRSIVDRFYDIIDTDAPVLRGMLPKDDSVSRDKLSAYLVEWTGGPALYTPIRGHPRMRMRHLPFAIGEAEVTTWLACMARCPRRQQHQRPGTSLPGQPIDQPRPPHAEPVTHDAVLA